MESSTSTHKTKIDKDEVLIFLNDIYPNQISNLEFISGGEGSQAFSFSADNEEYVIRVNRHSSDGFKKDEYAFLHFSSRGIPIPEISKIGQMNNGYYFCISKKIDAKLMKEFPQEEIYQMLPNMFNTLDLIHSLDVQNTVGYGKWKANAGAKSTTWKEFLLEVDMYAVGRDGRPNLFETSFLEKDVWENIHARFLELLQYCPEEKYLAHGDFGFDNLFIKDGKVAGVIDWEHSLYGDFLYDIAWLSFWSNGIDYETEYQKYIASINKDVPNLRERILCYKLCCGLGSLSFYAYSGQKDKYERSKEKLLELLK